MSISLYLVYLLISCLVVSETEMKIKQLKIIYCCHKNSFPVTLENNLDLCQGKLIIQQSIHLSLSSSIPTPRATFNPVVKLKYCHITASISHYDAFNLIQDLAFRWGWGLQQTNWNKSESAFYIVYCPCEQWWSADFSLSISSPQYKNPDYFCAKMTILYIAYMYSVCVCVCVHSQWSAWHCMTWLMPNVYL